MYLTLVDTGFLDLKLGPFVLVGEGKEPVAPNDDDKLASSFCSQQYVKTSLGESEAVPVSLKAVPIGIT